MVSTTKKIEQIKIDNWMVPLNILYESFFQTKNFQTETRCRTLQLPRSVSQKSK